MKKDTQSLRFAYKRVLSYLKLNGYPLIDTGAYKKKEVINIFIVLNDIKVNYPITKKNIEKFLVDQYNNCHSLIFKGNKMDRVPLGKSALNKRRKKAAKKSGKSKTNTFRQNYIDYINSEKWKSFKKSIKISRGNKCEICGVLGGKGVILDGHHLTYVRFKNELPSDIQIVCRDCHIKIHKH